MAGCIAVFIALFVSNYVDYVGKVEQAKYVDYDVKTITAGDYTVEFSISKD